MQDEPRITALERLLHGLERVVAYGIELTPERLRQVEEAERIIRPLCTGPLRVRHHGTRARIEVGREQQTVLNGPGVAEKIEDALEDLGFEEVVLDPEGYRSGSMNEGWV